MGILDLLYNSYKSMKEEESERDSYNAEIVTVQWDGYYWDYNERDHHTIVRGRMSREVANRVLYNERGILDQWLRKQLPDFNRRADGTVSTSDGEENYLNSWN